MKILFTFTLLLIAIVFCSCNKFLDEKPDATLNTPSSLKDLQGLLDNYNSLNAQFIGSSEILADNYYLTTEHWLALSREDQRNYYIWHADENNNYDWNLAYRNIYTCNLVLEGLNSLTLKNEDQSSAQNIRGAALFFRASYFYSVAQLFAKEYSLQTATTDLGIPLRLSTDLKEKSVRATISQTYEKIIDDLKLSVRYLPLNSGVKSRPSVAAAYGSLARVYLSMQDYSNASKYADSCLQLANTLIDYNHLDSNASTPFKIFNDEVIFQATSYPVQPLQPYMSKIDSSLYKSFDDNDLRKVIYFKPNGNGTFSFKGNYDGNAYNGQTFTGIATDEQYLIKAECAVRLGEKEVGLSYINGLLIKRWKTNTFIPFSATDIDSVLLHILAERRKELIFRSVRFSDLRRINNEGKFAATLHRKVNEVDYYLKPGAQEYVARIPKLVIEMSGIEQNP